MAQGDKYCAVCKKYLGNYMTGNANYFRMIRLKYCDVCKPMILNQQKNFSRHNRRVTYKQQNELLLTQNTLMKQQIALLREENEILREEVNSMYD